MVNRMDVPPQDNFTFFHYIEILRSVWEINIEKLNIRDIISGKLLGMVFSTLYTHWVGGELAPSDLPLIRTNVSMTCPPHSYPG